MLRIHLLAMRGAGEEELEEELARNPDVINCKTPNEGWTALHCAAKQGHKQTCVLLLSYPGVLVDEKDLDGRTPLGLACYNGHQDVAMLLRMSGACAQQKDLIGLSPRSWQIIDNL
ncbi:hypothetical protein BASA81_009838 [Batrachochytrium salamandrivorans]|nr:hypothetical protein BASA81_009838 [Batrachochytrium salamandrivorans]